VVVARRGGTIARHDERADPSFGLLALNAAAASIAAAIAVAPDAISLVVGW
jgi:hypothetical protein